MFIYHSSSHRVMCFIYKPHFSSTITLWGVYFISVPFLLRWGNWGSERLNDLPKAQQLIHEEGRIPVSIRLTPVSRCSTTLGCETKIPCGRNEALSTLAPEILTPDQKKVHDERKFSQFSYWVILGLWCIYGHRGWLQGDASWYNYDGEALGGVESPDSPEIQSWLREGLSVHGEITEALWTLASLFVKKK